jgi:hypothetical protein
MWPLPSVVTISSVSDIAFPKHPTELHQVSFTKSMACYRFRFHGNLPPPHTERYTSTVRRCLTIRPHDYSASLLRCWTKRASSGYAGSAIPP